MLTRNATTANTVTPSMRSLTPNPSTPTRLRDRIPLPHKLVKSISNPDIDRQSSMAAAVATPPGQQRLMGDPDHIMDTRTPSPVQRVGSVDSDGTDYKPDLSQEVAMLSTKLVNAINYQTNLDDTLQHTRHELEAERKKSVRLAAEKKSLDEMLAQGLLLKKTEVDKQLSRLRAELQQERLGRAAAEQAKKQVEGEIERLTTDLFEEANNMVAAARRDTEAMERRNSQLRGQLGDTEALLNSQQEQLQDLKATMERMSERGDNDTSPTKDGSVPSTPVDRTAPGFDGLHFSPDNGAPDFSPEHPLHFSQLLQPIMRNDIIAYADFQELLTFARRAAPHSRTGSGALQSAANNTASGSQTNLGGPFSGSSPSLPGAFSFGSSSSPTSNSANIAPPLKDSKFYKRTLTEDMEPCLRLDLAPGLSFLSRRTVLSSLLNGSLVVEPFSPQHKFYGPVYACALCGESRKQEPYVRNHRFRTSENEDAQRYPLCDYCLGRIRSVGDFVGFLRMVRDGHWRCEKEADEKGAWEESVRLRERMFWARLGGGVIPALAQQHLTSSLERRSSTKAVKSARQSLDSVQEEALARRMRHRPNASTATAGPGAEAEKTQTDASAEDGTEGSVMNKLLTTSSSVAMAPSGRHRELSVSRPEQEAETSTEEDSPAQSQEAMDMADEQLRSEASLADKPVDPAHGAALEPPATPGSDDGFVTPSAEKDEPILQAGDSGTPPIDAEGTQPTQSVEASEPELQRSATNASAKSSSSDMMQPPDTQSEGHERRPSAIQLRIQAMEARAKSGQ